MSSLERARPFFSLISRRSSFSVSAMTLSMSTPIIIQTSKPAAPARHDHHTRGYYQSATGNGGRTRTFAKEEEGQHNSQQGLQVAQYPGLLRRDLPYSVHIKHYRNRGVKKPHGGKDQRLGKRQGQPVRVEDECPEQGQGNCALIEGDLEGVVSRAQAPRKDDYQRVEDPRDRPCKRPHEPCSAGYFKAAQEQQHEAGHSQDQRRNGRAVHPVLQHKRGQNRHEYRSAVMRKDGYGHGGDPQRVEVQRYVRQREQA